MKLKIDLIGAGSISKLSAVSNFSYSKTPKPVILMVSKKEALNVWRL